MSNRRSFIRKTFLTAGTLSIGSFFKEAVAEDVKNALVEMNTLSPMQAAQDEEIWARIQQAYTTSSTMINLNNGQI